MTNTKIHNRTTDHEISLANTCKTYGETTNNWLYTKMLTNGITGM